MAKKRGGFEKKSKAASEIPTASMADIAFLLLIFFMVSTTFRREQPRHLSFPRAQATQKIDERRRNILHVWIEPSGDVYINDARIPMEQVGEVVLPLYRESDRRLLVSLRGDRDVPYRFINSVTEELRSANAVRVFFHTDLESRLTRERR
ncbi:MAG: biopolymer transporter ExbD [Gemmatimonadota bacterium]|nr:MAG: biopolymer transporter ExbD [Gemmatimonadota bacterium]